MTMPARPIDDDLANEISELQDRLATIERDRIDPRDAKIAEVRRELEEKRTSLTRAQESEGAELRHRQAIDAFGTADRELAGAKAELDDLEMQFRALPDRIRATQRRFFIALDNRNKTKLILEALS